jgi:hypothetical protein
MIRKEVEMYQLFSKDENISNSTIYIAFLILKILKKKDATIFDIVDYLKKKNIINSKEIIISLSILFSMDLIEFKEPYICVKK